jgi:hypothetical protein
VGFLFFGALIKGLEPMSAIGKQEPDFEFSQSEHALLKDVVSAVKGIRYGSVVLTIHDGRIVEVSKTERIRRSST